MSSSSRPDLPQCWLGELEAHFATSEMRDLRSFLVKEKSENHVYPPGKMIFNAFHKSPLEKVKVVILGQDPYHGPGQAHGLCFSVQDGVPPPPSLVNIFKELKSDLGLDIPKQGNLTSWAEQGVFLLNTVLTVRHKTPQSHAGKGWEGFTDRVIQTLNEKRDGLVFLLWGSPARKKAAMIDTDKHLILEAPHPSPLSAHRGFLGCGHFSKTNAYLEGRGVVGINWSLP